MNFPTNHWLYNLKAEILKIEPTAQLILYGSSINATSID